MRPGKKDTHRWYLRLAAQRTRCSSLPCIVPPAYLPCHTYSLVRPGYACLPTHLRPDLRGGTPGPKIPLPPSVKQGDVEIRGALPCAALHCSCSCNATPPYPLPTWLLAGLLNNQSPCASLKSHLCNLQRRKATRRAESPGKQLRPEKGTRTSKQVSIRPSSARLIGCLQAQSHPHTRLTYPSSQDPTYVPRFTGFMDSASLYVDLHSDLAESSHSLPCLI